MRSRAMAVAAVLGAAALTTTTVTVEAVAEDGSSTVADVATAQATTQNPQPSEAAVQPFEHVKVTKKTAPIKVEYYNSSRTVVTLMRGDSVNIASLHENSYGHLWYLVTYSTREKDYHGWMSANWIDGPV